MIVGESIQSDGDAISKLLIVKDVSNGEEYSHYYY